MSDVANQTGGALNPHETVTGTFMRLAPWTLGARAVVMVMSVVATAVLTQLFTKTQWEDYSFLKTFWLYIWMMGQLGLGSS